MEVSVGHPDAYGGIFLEEELASGDFVSVTAAEGPSEGELYGAEDDGGYCQGYYTADISLSVQEDEVDGLAECDE